MANDEDTRVGGGSDGARRHAEDAPFIDVEWADEDDVAWEEDDGEDELEGPPLDFLAFSGAFDVDDSSDERWLQSCLRGLVAPDLAVDGVPGGRTRQAIRTFQRRIKQLRPGARALAVDGIAGPATIAALELCSNSSRPGRSEAERRAATAASSATPPAATEPPREACPPGAASTGPFAVTTEPHADGDRHVITAYGDRVAFRYRTRERTGLDGKTRRDPFNVMTYEGARRDLLTDAALLQVGLSQPEIDILRENAFKESRGSFGAVNTWDDQLVSWGMAQFAGHAGSLASLLLFLKEKMPAAFARFFTAVGIDVDYGPYPWIDRKQRREVTRTGAHVRIAVDGETLAGDRAWSHLRTQPRLVGALMLAGNDVDIQRGQCLFWKEKFLDRAVATRLGKRERYKVVRVRGSGSSRVETTLLAGASSAAEWRAWAAAPENRVEGKDLADLLAASGKRSVLRTREGDRVVAEREATAGHPLGAFCTSTYGLGIMARLYNWMPAYVRAWSEEFMRELAADRPGVDVLDPATWARDPSLEPAFLERVKARRRAVKRGSYDPPYGDTLSKAPGSFVAGDGEPPPLEAPTSEADDTTEAAEAPTSEADDTTEAAEATPNATPGAVAAAAVRPVPEDRPDIDVTARSPVDKRKRTRAWTDITGITLHQTGVHGFGARAWPRVTAHLGVHSDGTVYLIHPLQAYLWSSDALNRDTIAIEVAGNFIGDPARADSYWKPGGGPSTLTPAMIEGLRRAIRWIVAEVARHGGEITDIYAHRQAKRGKSNCPGAAIWLHAGVWAQTQLGLGNGGPGFTRADGRPIPPAWDPRLLDQPLPFRDPDDEVIDFEAMSPEDGAEFPAEGEDPFAAASPIVAAAARVRGLPAGMDLVERTGASQGPLRGALDLGAPVDLDAIDDGALLAELDAALARQGLVAVDTIELRPAARTRGLDLLAPLAVDDALDFEITLEEDEQAVTLVEQDGLFTWVLPEAPSEGPQTRAAGRAVARFRVEVGARDVPEDSSEPTRGLGGVVGKALCARVYKFFAGALARLALPAAVARLERDQREGPVLVRGDALRDWVDRDDLAELELPRDRPARVLLLVHGTFSSTRGSFGGLCAGAGQAALRGMLARYDAVLGVDHRTLSRWPRDNAAAILEHLRTHPWPAPPELDIVCFSRGGLVARELIERVLPASGWPATIGRVICVATTNAGTELARPSNWSALVDTYTTLACAAMRGFGALGLGIAGLVGGEIVAAVGALVQALVACGVSDGAVPGLAAMDPDGEVVRALDDAPPPAGPSPRYHAISSCYDAALAGGEDGLTAYAKRVLAGRITDRLYRGAASDLVVHNASTHALHPGRTYVERHHFAANATVYHVNFFVQPEVVARLVQWLELGEARAPTPAGLVMPRLVRREADVDGPLAFAADEALVDLHLRAEAPARVGLEEIFDVRVELSREALAAAAGAHAALSRALVEEHELVTVELVARAGASPVAYAPATIAVPPPAARAGLWFRARAEQLGEAELWIVARQRGRPLARLVVRVEVTQGTGASAERVDAAATTAGDGREAGAVLEVIELREAAGLRYRYHLRAPALGLHHRFESALVPTGADDYVRGLYDRIEREWKLAGGEPRAFDRRLRGLGVQLGEQLLPRELMALLWDRRAQLVGLQLLSDEGQIPWELVHLKHPDRPLAADERGFLGQLGLVRALWGVALPARIAAREGHVFSVVPEYPSAALALPSAMSERTWLERHLGARPRDARQGPVLDLLATPGGFDLLHFACHGEVEPHDAWLLLQGEVREVQEAGVTRRKWFPDRLGAAEVAAEGDLRGPDGRRPLVFLNACKVARAGHLLTGFSGWAPALLRTGAGAVVAPLWSVGDGAALRFAEGFYGGLLQGGSFAEAAMTAREHARALGDPTWLAYAVYAAPDGRLHVQRAKSPQAS